MMDYREIEKLLIERPTDWGEDLVAALPELEPMSDTPQSHRRHTGRDVAIWNRLTNDQPENI